MLQDLGSHYLPILLTIPLSPVSCPNERPPSFNFQKACWDDFALYFDPHCPSTEEYPSFSLTSAAALFTSLALNAAKSSIPFGRIKRPPKAWWFAEVEGAVSEKRKAFAAAHRSDEDRQAYISASRNASSVIAKAKAEAWQTTCSSLSPKSNPKSVYSLIRSIAGSPYSYSSSPNFPNYTSPGWFPFLSVTNNTKLERLHRAASRVITGFLSSSPIPLLLSEASRPPLRVTLTHFTLSSYEQALRLPTSFPISGLARLGVKPRLCRSSWRAFVSTHPLITSSTSPREALLGCLSFPPWNLPSFTVESTLSSSYSRSVSPFSRQGAGLTHLDSLLPHDLVLWTNSSFPFPLGKGGSGALANCFQCGTQTTLSFTTGPVGSGFSAEACAILHALCWSRQHQQVCHFSSLLLLFDFCSVLSSVFSFI